MKKYPLKLKSVYKDIIWGGDTLIKEFHKKDFTGVHLAESWELTIHKEGVSVIENGEYAGKTLAEYLGIFQKGDGSYDFPLLVKFIDARDKLSVQVHPNKTELWYIIAAEEGAQLVYGLNGDFCEESFRNAIVRGELERLLHFVDIKAGEFYLLPSGLVHAIGKGILIAEFQQNSNVTYRVYDYNRGREVHTEQAIETIKTLSVNGDYSGMTECEYFKVGKHVISGEKTTFCAKDTFVHVLCIHGCGQLEGQEIREGDSYFIPCGYGSFCVDGNLEIILTEPK